MTRLYALPRPDLDEPWSAEKVALFSIRHRISRIAARITSKPERIVEAVGALRVEVERLEALVDVEEVER